MIVLYIFLGGIAACLLLLWVAALLVDPQKDYKTHSRFYRNLLNGATAIAVRLCRLKIHTSGLEKIPDGKQILFVCNHRSKFDPIITWHILRDKDIAFVSKPENFNIPIFGKLIRRCCFLPIDRENPRNAIKTIHKAVKLIKSDQVSIGIYPEGTRSTNSELLPFHNGVFKIAQKANAPIVVLAVRGTDRIHKNYPFRTSHIYLDVLDVITPAELGSSTAVIGQQVRDLIQSHLETEV